MDKELLTTRVEHDFESTPTFDTYMPLYFEHPTMTVRYSIFKYLSHTGKKFAKVLYAHGRRNAAIAVTTIFLVYLGYLVRLSPPETRSVARLPGWKTVHVYVGNSSYGPTGLKWFSQVGDEMK